MHVWFNLKSGNAIGWLLDLCLKRKSILPDDPDSPEAVREQKERGKQPDKLKDDFEIPRVRNDMNPKSPGTCLHAFLLNVPSHCLLYVNHVVCNRCPFCHHL